VAIRCVLRGEDEGLSVRGYFQHVHVEAVSPDGDEGKGKSLYIGGSSAPFVDIRKHK
jgi:hypothetical protein